MTDLVSKENDSALQALDALTEVTESSAQELTTVNKSLVMMREHRVRGWSWRRIFAEGDAADVLADVADVLARLGRASGEFRRTLARALRTDGLRMSDIAELLDVSRQRVGALIRGRRDD